MFSKTFVMAALVGLVGAVLLLGYRRVPIPRVAAHEGEGLIVLYSEPGFQGKTLIVTDSLLDMPKEQLGDGTVFDWNENVRSMRVIAGTWRLYQHGRANSVLDDTPLMSLDIGSKPATHGWTSLVSASVFGEVGYADSAAGGWGEDISSIELVSLDALPEWALVPREGWR